MRSRKTRSWLTSSTVPSKSPISSSSSSSVSISRSLVGSSSTSTLAGLANRLGQHQPVALAARQRLHRRHRALAREQEVGEVADDVPRLAVDDDGGVAVVDAVGDGRLGIELFALLIEVGDLQAGAVLDRAAVGLHLAEQQPQQRRLAGAVRTDQADAVAAQDPHREVRMTGTPSNALLTPLGLEHQLAGASPAVDRQPHVAGLRAVRRALGAQLHQVLDAPFVPRPPRLDALAQPRLFLRQLLVEPGEIARLVLEWRRPSSRDTSR